MLIVLTGIDGSGKTTAAEATVSAACQNGRNALILRNHAGRRRMSLLSAKLGVQLHPRLADLFETTVRIVNVLISHWRARGFSGLVLMDRHLHCQLALREMRGLPRGRFVPFLIRLLPQPDLVVYLDVDPRDAHQRILARGTDSENLEDLTSLRDAYQQLPEFPYFTNLAADGTQAEVLSRLRSAIEKSEGSPGTD